MRFYYLKNWKLAPLVHCTIKKVTAQKVGI